MNRHVRSFVLLLTVCATGVSFGAEVMKIGKTPDMLMVSQNPERAFNAGDFLCVYHGSHAIACGTVSKTNSTAALMRVTMRNHAQEVAVGDRVGLSTRPHNEKTPGNASAESHDSGPSLLTSRWHLSIELLGAAFAYSIFTSYRPSRYLAINGGFSFFPLSASANGVTASGTVLQFPLSVSALLFGVSHSLEILGGIDVLSLSGTGTVPGLSSGSYSGTSILPEFGIGFRYWPHDGGFHFRATVYFIFPPSASVNTTAPSSGTVTQSTSSLLPWVGMSLGYAF